MIDEEKAEEYVRIIHHDVNNWGGKEPTERFYNEVKFKQAYLDGLTEGRNEQRKIFSENCIRCENKKVE